MTPLDSIRITVFLILTIVANLILGHYTKLLFKLMGANMITIKDIIGVYFFWLIFTGLASMLILIKLDND